ncbi:hypothetical protein [Paraburkholderia strydomiana]|uniref:hypothetical protein n=1 Tax=Paraburkholderia strydomiana TaxID=1245417 RepID=UPI0038BA0194
MRFETLFEGKSWPEVQERIGVMSVDSLNRQWEFVREKRGYLIAKSRDCKDALLGRMCERNDGKFCVEIVVRAQIEGSRLRQLEFWYTDRADRLRYGRQLYDGLQGSVQIES